MASLNLNDPNHPSFSYTSDGQTVSAGVACNCHGDAACLERCHGKAQTLLDEALLIFPEDP